MGGVYFTAPVWPQQKMTHSATKVMKMITGRLSRTFQLPVLDNPEICGVRRPCRLWGRMYFANLKGVVVCSECDLLKGLGYEWEFACLAWLLRVFNETASNFGVDKVWCLYFPMPFLSYSNPVALSAIQPLKRNSRQWKGLSVIRWSPYRGSVSASGEHTGPSLRLSSKAGSVSSSPKLRYE